MSYARPHTPTLLLLLLITVGQFMSVYSTTCSMGAGGDMPAGVTSGQAAIAMVHDHEAMLDVEVAPTDNCCGGSGECPMAQCAAPVAALDMPDLLSASSRSLYRLLALPSAPELKLPALLRPPIFV